MPIAVAAAVVGAVAVGVAKAQGAPSSINEQRAQAIQRQAEDKALEESDKGFAFQAEQLQPYIDVGKRSLATLDTDIEELTRPFTTEDFEADPGFKFRIEQGERGINAFLRSRGLSESGRAGKELVRFNQGEATSEFTNAFNRFQTTQGNRFNRLLALTGLGANATNALVDASARNTQQNVNTIRGTGQNLAQQQSRIGDIENQARERRSDAVAGAFKSISESVGTLGAGGGGGGVT